MAYWTKKENTIFRNKLTSLERGPQQCGQLFFGGYPLTRIALLQLVVHMARQYKFGARIQVKASE